MTIPWNHYKQRYGDDFVMVRRAIFLNFVSAKAGIKEEDLSPQDVVILIQQVGQDYMRRNKRGISDIR